MKMESRFFLVRIARVFPEPKALKGFRPEREAINLIFTSTAHPPSQSISSIGYRGLFLFRYLFGSM